MGGNLALAKSGANTLWLNGNNSSYTGGTTVYNGLLLLTPSGGINSNGFGPTGAGDVTVMGGTLQGTATINGNLNVGEAGTVRPGTVNPLVAAAAGQPWGVASAPWTLNVTGSAGVSPGAAFWFDIGTGSSSLLTIANAPSLPTGGQATVNLNNLGGLSGNVPLFTYGSLTNTFSPGQLAVAPLPTRRAIIRLPITAARSASWRPIS